MILSCPGRGAHPPGGLRWRRHRLPRLLYLLCLGVALLFGQPALAQPSLARVGDPAPSFSLPTIA